MGREKPFARGFQRKDIKRNTRIGHRIVNVITSYKPEDSLVEKITNAFPNSTVDDEILEITGDASSFHNFISSFKKENKFGASVYVYTKKDYKKMRLFITLDGKS